MGINAGLYIIEDCIIVCTSALALTDTLIAHNLQELVCHAVIL